MSENTCQRQGKYDMRERGREKIRKNAKEAKRIREREVLEL